MGGQFIRFGHISWQTFEDGFPNVFINNVDSIRGVNVIFMVSLLNQQTLLAKLSVLFSLPRYLVKSLLLVLPYYPTGTMERVDTEGQIATAHTLARILSLIPPTQSGPAKILIYDIHALANRFYFLDGVLPLLVSAVPEFVKKLKESYANEDIAIAFPDEGAGKRFARYFLPEGWGLITCTKVRGEADTRYVTVKEGKATGKHVFIIDDLTKTGGTLIECQLALLRAGAKDVSAFITHAVFPQESWKKFTQPKSTPRFRKIYITDTCPESARTLASLPPFELLSLAPSLYDNIQKYTHRSPAIAAL
eukprot:TRINITY_DN3213_c0_g1_i2.p1 TRINITY_DN3213_c0_g1~~TRINITY_DN3213_c0_g1_i2.p1  ORF type:complete len:306 (-),score=29.08 TRINITY_DN3213_c0_g1_i2:100-1017(-)